MTYLELLQERAHRAELALGDARSRLSEHPTPLTLTVDSIREILLAMAEAHEWITGKNDAVLMTVLTKENTP